MLFQQTPTATTSSCTGVSAAHQALAEMWHARVRAELGFAHEDARDLSGILKLQHRGARYAWGYPACADVENQTKVAELCSGGGPVSS